MVGSGSGLIKCQFDSYLKHYRAQVIKCEPVSASQRKASKSPIPKDATHSVILEDTILFCEGGGQPSDHGTINGVPVVHISRGPNGEIQHYTKGALEPNKEVDISLNWERRFDHMQQHSGQHLLSAIGENDFGWETTSWWLGETICNVEFTPTKKEFPVSSENLSIVESKVNEIIRDNRKVTVHLVESPQEVSSDSSANDRKSSERHHGALRVIEIEGVDKNQCCGTHVSHTSQLQVMKLLGTEKTRGQIRVFFIFGHRVVQFLEKNVPA